MSRMQHHMHFPRITRFFFHYCVAVFLLCAGARAQSTISPEALLDSAAVLLHHDPTRSAELASRAFDRAVNDYQRAISSYASGNAWRWAGNNEKAAQAFRTGLDFAQAAGLPELHTKLLDGLGVVERLMGYVNNALLLHLEALAISDSLSQGAGSAEAMNHIGATLRELGRIDEAMLYHRRALRLFTSLDNTAGVAASLVGIGTIHCLAGHLDSAGICIARAVQLQRDITPYGNALAEMLTALATVHREKGEIEKARSFYGEAVKIGRATKNAHTLANTHYHLGVLELQVGNPSRARAVFMEAKAFARASRLARIILNVLEGLSDAYDAEGLYREALNVQRQYRVTSDSLAVLLQDQRVQEAEARYQRELHERHSSDLASLDKQYRQWLLIAALVASIFLVVAVSFVLRMAKKKDETISRHQQQVEELRGEVDEVRTRLVVSEERYKLLFDGLPIGVFFYDRELHILHANRAFSELFNMPQSACDGFDLASFHDASVIEALASPFHDRYGVYEGDLRFDEHGSRLTISLRTAPFRSEALGDSIAMGFILDISAWEQVESELIGATEAAEQAMKLKQAFLTGISHEIRTPLNIIMGYLGVLQSELEDRASATEQEYFCKVDLGVRRLLRTVDQLLSLSLLESGSFTPQQETFSLSELITELVEETVGLAEDKRVSVHWSPAPEEILVFADKFSVAQSIRNLLDNAVKFTDRGEITVSARSKGDVATIAIADTGIGIGDSYLRQLYEAFTQESVGYTRPYEGLGLGLTLAKRYVDANNGTISVKSTKGLGSVFTISFPVTKEKIEHEDGQHYSMRSITGDKPCVLVVEDDSETRRFLQLVLSDAYRLLFSDNARLAWDILHSEHVDIVLMDISLRGDEDGLSLTRRIRGDQSIAQTPVIAVTAHAFADDRRRSFEAGCDDYIAKPFRTRHLQEHIDRWLKEASDAS